MITTSDPTHLAMNGARMNANYLTMLALVNDARHAYSMRMREWHTIPRASLMHTVGQVSALERIAREHILDAHYRAMEEVTHHTLASYNDMQGATVERSEVLALYAMLDYMLGRLHYACATEPGDRDVPVRTIVCHCHLCPVTPVSPAEWDGRHDNYNWEPGL